MLLVPVRLAVTAFADKSTLIENIIDSLRTPPQSAAAFQSCDVQCKNYYLSLPRHFHKYNTNFAFVAA